MKFKDRLKDIPGAWYFLIVIILIYLGFLIFDKNIFIESLKFFFQIFIKIIPLFLLIFVLMILSNFFISQKFIIKHLGSKGVKKWFFVVIGGILSAGPIYMWYPLLADLKKKGLKQGLLACFLYNRAIKIPLLPLAILYFGWQYILILSIVMIVTSVIQGLLLNKLLEM